MTENTFAALYCDKHGIKPEEYDAVVLKRSLYPHARLLAPLLRALWPEYFTADLDFVRSVGRLRRFREFNYEAEEFAHHPANRGFWRLNVNMRVSSRALRRMVRVTLHPELEEQAEVDDRTTVPFPMRQGAGKEVRTKKHSSEASA
jgi:hypothetical protein